MYLSCVYKNKAGFLLFGGGRGGDFAMDIESAMDKIIASLKVAQKECATNGDTHASR